MRKSYCIAFYSHDKPGHIEAVQVTLDKIMVGMEALVNVDLSAHPLYPALCAYVKNNPPQKES